MYLRSHETVSKAELNTGRRACLEVVFTLLLQIPRDVIDCLDRVSEIKNSPWILKSFIEGIFRCFSYHLFL